jgi:hypothetical protein
MKAFTLILTLAALTAFAAQAAQAMGPDADTTIRYMAPKSGQYQLTIVNTSSVGYINAVDWVPPSGLTVTAVKNTVGGKCRLASNVISCSGAKGTKGIAPPTCLCRPGASVTVTFSATGYSPKFNGHYWTYYGFAGDTNITSMTPVPYQIPSTMAQVPNPDLPICPLGTQPDPTDPTCIVEGIWYGTGVIEVMLVSPAKP